jgi:apoptosis-inducing factor 2
MKKIVIIGGGFTGAYCAKNLENDFDVTLIDHKDYFEYTPSVLRTIVEPNHINKIQAMHKDYLKKAKIINAEVTEISKQNVTIKNKKIPFDYLVIASGSSYNSPIKEEGMIPATRAKELVDCHKDLEKAKKVLIIGGGLVGVELAAEICTHYKNKEITLVHSKSNLIERNHKKSQKYSEKFLKKQGVKILFDEKVKLKKGKKLITEKGTEIKTDMPFMCVGIKANYEFMQNKFSDCLNEKNQIKINEYLQLGKNKNIFVGGDVSATKEEKTAQTSENHAQLIVKNIRCLKKGESLESYRPIKRPMVISLGKRNAIFEYNNFVFTGLFPTILKWFVEWKTMIRYKK